MMIISYTSGIAIFIFKWYDTRLRSRVCDLIHMEIWQKRLKLLITNLESFILFKICQFLVIYKVPNLSIELLDSSKQ